LAGAAPGEGILPAVAFVGRKNSGKTTLVVQVVAALAARGLRVGTLKHHSHAGFAMDIEGKDSWRHRQAGSCYTVVASPDQLGSVRALAKELPVERILVEMSAAARDAEGRPELDLIVVEGYRASGLPTIEIFRADNPNDETRPLEPDLPGLIAVATDQPRIVEAAAARGIPTFSLTDIAAITDFVQGRFVCPGPCSCATAP
jgi:molybdopterin-guanine dinucleotide biosynthesis protein MobB